MVYFAYGFPSSYRLIDDRNDSHHKIGKIPEVVVSRWEKRAGGGDDIVVVVTETDVLIWSGGQHRYLMGSCRLYDSTQDKGHTDVRGQYNTQYHHEQDHQHYRHGCIMMACMAVVSGKHLVAAVTKEGEVVVVSCEESLRRHHWHDWTAVLDDVSMMEYTIHVEVRDTVVDTDDVEDDGRVVGMCADETCFCVVFPSGDFVTYTWSGVVISRHSPLEYLEDLQGLRVGENRIIHVTYVEMRALLGLVFDNGMVVVIKGSCDTGLRGLCSGEEHGKNSMVYVPDMMGSPPALMSCFHPEGQFLAVGTEESTVVLCDISVFVNSGINVKDGDNSNNIPSVELSLVPWGYDPLGLGHVSSLAWSPDGKAIAVGYGRKGMTVWNTRGCRLFCSLPPAYNEHGISGPLSPKSMQTTYSSKSGVSAQRISTRGSFDRYMLDDKDARYSPDSPILDHSNTGLFERGVVYISWSNDGGHVLVHERQSSVIFDLPFARCSHNHLILTSHAPNYRSSTKLTGNETKISLLICSDRLILIQEMPVQCAREKVDQLQMDVPGVSVQHVRVPQQYLDSAFPITSASLNTCGTDIVVSGSHGIALYTISSKRWRLIGDISQDKAIMASHVGWIHDDVILVCASISSSKSKRLPDSKAALIFFPKGHLDASSILGFETLDSIPLLLDISNERISLCFENGSVQILQYSIVTGSNNPVTVEKVDVHEEYSFKVPKHMKAKSLSVMRKCHESGLWCIVLGENGELGCIDIQNGSYSVLSHDTDYYWIPHYETHTVDNNQPLRFDLPWWTYGKGGMKLWFDNISPELHEEMHKCLDPELEFDPEVLPIGVSLQDLSILGLMHRAHRKQHFSNPASSVDFAPLPESQPVLACLLRRLLRKGQFQDALYLADLYSLRPHFPRSMEWLLFTSLESNAKQQEEKGLPIKEAGIELMKTAELISQFPQSSELVISVARKMDAEMWPSLFQAAGSPITICETLLHDGALQHASCCLLIVSEVVGKSEASHLALKTLKSAISVSNYTLCVDLLRFLASQEHDMNPQYGRENVDQVQKNNNYVAWLWNWIAPEQEHNFSPNDDCSAPTRKETHSLHQEQTLHEKLRSSLSLGTDASDSKQIIEPLIDAWRSLAKQAWRLLDSGSVRELAALDKAMEGVYGGLSALFETTKELHACSLGHRTPSASLIANALFISSNEMASASESELESIPGLLQSLLEAGNINYAVALAIVANNQKVMRAFVEENSRTWESLQTLISNDVHLCAFSSVLLLASGVSPLGRTMTV